MTGARPEDGAKKTTNSAKENSAELIGERHAETTVDADEAKDHGGAMDAVREVVQSEGTNEDTERPAESDADRAMEAIREVVEKE